MGTESAEPLGKPPASADHQIRGVLQRSLAYYLGNAAALHANGPLGSGCPLQLVNLFSRGIHGIGQKTLALRMKGIGRRSTRHRMHEGDGRARFLRLRPVM